MTAPPQRHVIFDLDGTLVDSAPGVLASLEAALASSGIAARRALTPDLVGPPLGATLALVAGPQEPAKLEELACSFKAHYDREGCRHVTVFPGVDAMLDRLLAAGLALHIATHKRRSPTLAILEHLGWSRRFVSVYANDTRTPPFRDKAEMISRQIEERALPRAAVAYVGDRIEDGQAADANRLPFYLAAWGYGPPAAAVPGHWRVAHAPEAIR